MKRKFLVLALAISLVLGLALPAFAAESALATNMKLDSFSGTVTTKNASGKSMTTRKDMRLYNGYTITTGKNSNAYISLDDSKAVKLDSFTTVSIKKNGKKLELQVVSGSLFFNVTEPLKGDEKLNIRTTTMVTGIRGTSGVASVRPAEIELSSDGTAVTKNVWDESVQLFTGKAVIEAVVSSSVNSVVSTAEGSDAIEEDSILSLIFGGSKTEPAEIPAEETIQVVINAGETVVSRTVSKDEEVEEYEVVKLGTKPADVPSIALEEIAKDEELKSEIEEQAPQILYEDVEQQLTEVAQAEENKEEAKAEKVEEELKQDEEKTEEIVDQMFEEAKEEEYYEPAPSPVAPAPSDPVAPVGPSVTLTAPTAAEYLAALNNPDIKDITLQNANITITETDLDGNSVNIPAGKSVTLASGSVTVDSSIYMEVSGTLNVAQGATFTAGDVAIKSTNSVHVSGTLTVDGALTVGDDDNAGLLEITETGELTVAPSDAHELALYIHNGSFALSGTLNVSGESTYHNLYIYSDAAATFSQSAKVKLGHGTDNDDVDSTIFVHGSLDTSCGLDAETSIVNYGTTTFNNGYVGAITNRGVNDQEKTAGSLTINNGNVDIIWNEDQCTTVQTGGTVAQVENNGGTYTITGGEIGFATNRSEMTIEGGVIKGDENPNNPNEIVNYGKLTVSGSTEVYRTIRNSEEENGAGGISTGEMTIAAGGILKIANNNFIEVQSGSALNIEQGAKVELATKVEDPIDIWIGINVNDGANLRTAGTFASGAAINNYGNTVIENGYITYVYNYESGNVTMGGCVVDKLSNNGQAVATINGGEFSEIYNESTAALHVNGPIVHVQTPDSNYLFTSMYQLAGVDFSSNASIIASVYEQEIEPGISEYKQAFFFDNYKETISFFHENVIITTRNYNKYYAEPIGDNLYKMDFSKSESYYLTANYTGSINEDDVYSINSDSMYAKIINISDAEIDSDGWSFSISNDVRIVNSTITLAGITVEDNGTLNMTDSAIRAISPEWSLISGNKDNIGQFSNVTLIAEITKDDTTGEYQQHFFDDSMYPAGMNNPQLSFDGTYFDLVNPFDTTSSLRLTPVEVDGFVGTYSVTITKQ